MTTGLLSLKWNNHRSTFFHNLCKIRCQDLYSDVTLACDGNYYFLHKFVLSVCSEYFEQIFVRTQCKHPVIVINDISSSVLNDLVSYMYVGEVNVSQEDLSALIRAAEHLKIRGLALPDEEPSADDVMREGATRRQGVGINNGGGGGSSSRNDCGIKDGGHRNGMNKEKNTDGSADDTVHEVRSQKRPADREASAISRSKRRKEFDEECRPQSQQRNRIGHGVQSSYASNSSSHARCSDNINDLYSNITDEARDDSNCKSFSVTTRKRSCSLDDGVQAKTALCDVKPEPADCDPGRLDEDSLLGGLEGDSCGVKQQPDDAFQPGDGEEDERGQQSCFQPVHHDEWPDQQQQVAPTGIVSAAAAAAAATAAMLDSQNPFPLHQHQQHHLDSSSPTAALLSPLGLGVYLSPQDLVFNSTIRTARALEDLTRSPSCAGNAGGCTTKNHHHNNHQHHPQQQQHHHHMTLLQCASCSYTTHRKRNLDLHLRTHSGERPYGCPYCSYRSTQQPNLDKHMLTHTREKPFSCPHCPDQFRQKHHLGRHLSRKHGQQQAPSHDATTATTSAASDTSSAAVSDSASSASSIHKTS